MKKMTKKDLATTNGGFQTPAGGDLLKAIEANKNPDNKNRPWWFLLSYNDGSYQV